MFLPTSVVIDGYPVTKYQVSLLEARSIIPMIIFELDVPSKEIFRRLLLEKKRSQGNVCDENSNKRVNINHPEEETGFLTTFSIPSLFLS